MPEIEVKKDESFESALRRFKKKIEQEGILREVRDRKHYEKPSERKRKRAKRPAMTNRRFKLFPPPGFPEGRSA